MSTHPLSEKWLQEAALLRRHGAIEAATTKEACAAELDAYSLQHELEALPLSEAAKESGLSVGHLGRLLADERIENVGVKGAPRIRRGDLPRKAPPPPSDAVDLVGLVRQKSGLR